MIKDKRIQTICKFVDCKVVADIGADHGYITKFLLENNLIDFSFLTDKSEKCLSKAVKNLINYKGKTCFLVGDGLDVFSKQNNSLELNLGINCSKMLPEQIIIAGMGGMEIIKILSRPYSNKFKKFILQPQTNIVEVRKFLQNNCFKIDKDVIAKQGKMFYNVIVCEKTNSIHKLSCEEILFGKTNLLERGKDFISYINFEIEKSKKILERSFVEEIANKLSYLKKLL